MLLLSLDDIIDKIDGCTSPEAIRDVTNEFKTKTVPLTELLGTTTSAIGELTKARKTHDGLKPGGKSDDKKPAAPVRTVLFDEGVTHALEIPTFDEGSENIAEASADVLFSTRLNLKCKVAEMAAITELPDIANFFKTFKDMVKQNETQIYKDTDGRTSAKASEKAALAIKARVTSILPQLVCEDSLLKSKDKDILKVLKEQSDVSFFALLKGVDSAGIEKELPLACV